MKVESEMADDMDVDDLLEAPYKKEDVVKVSDSKKSRENGLPEKDRKDKSRRERSKDHDRTDKDKDRDRNKDKDRGDRTKEKDRTDRGKDKDKDHNKDKDRGERKDKDKSDKDKEKDRNRDKDRKDVRKRSRERSRDRKTTHEKKRRSRSREKERRRSRERRGSRDRGSRRSRSRERRRSRTPKRELTAEERDARTVFCMQLSSRIRARDLEDFFSVVGKVTDVRIITDAKTRRSKGIAYVEFVDVESVPLALGLSGQKILGVPIVMQPTMAEKNRAASAATGENTESPGPMRLYIGSLHFNITEDMLRAIFEPFGKIEHIQLIMDSETNRSKGYGFITFRNSEDAKKALEQMNGFELAGRPMKVNHVTERSEPMNGGSLLDTDDMERAGIDLGATGRLQLMAKLAEGTGLQLPPAAANALMQPSQTAAPAVATQCFLLSNMFDPITETNTNWAEEIRDDVVEECNKHGGVLHVWVDRQSAQGNVYVKCPSIPTAVASVNSLHGRWFAGKMITAAYIPLMSYHSLFPETMMSSTLLKTQFPR